MSNRWLFLCLLWLAGIISAQQKQDFYFYTEDDLKNVRISSQTDWGQRILSNLKSVVEERELHDLSIPTLEGGHGHHYFCPIHNTQFVFDWNRPQEHYCEACKKAWKGVPKYDWAWVNFVHAANLKYLTANMYLYMATELPAYAYKIKDMLLDLSKKYPAYIIHDRERKYTPGTSGKMYGQSLDEAVWAIDAARAYSVASSVMTDQERMQIEKGYLRPCAELLMNSRDKGNWQVWHNGAIMALGVALKNDSIIDVALNKPICGYRDMMKNNVYGDGWWNEGSVVYHFYPLRAILLSAEAVRCRNIDLYDQKMVNMFLSPIQMLYSDLSFPSQNDGWYGTRLVEQAGLYEVVAVRINDDNLNEVLALCYQENDRLAPEALLSGRSYDKMVSKPELESKLFPNLGVGVLRSGKRCVVLKSGPTGGLHGHPDKLSISIHDGRKEILPDLGTTAYGVPDCYEWYRRTISHNTVTVDKHDQKSTQGEIFSFQPTKKGGTIHAGGGSVYEGVNMERTLVLKGSVLYDKFIVDSEDEHIYDYTLILREPLKLSGAQNDTLPEYSRISKIKSTKGKNCLKFTMNDGTKVSIKMSSPSCVYQGIAPGLPPKGQREGEDVYPLIIRTKGKAMKVDVRWTLRN